MTRDRLRQILADEFERTEGLPHGSAEHIEKIRKGENIGAGIKAALRAMELACRECGGM